MKKLWLGLMMFVLVVSGYTNAQTYTVPYSGSSTGTVTPGVTCNIYDHAGANNNYSNYCNGTLVLHSLSGQTINITGSYNTESCCDRINIYNGSSTSSTLLGTFKGTGNINVTSTGSYITINFYSDGSVVRSGFELTATTQCSNNPLWVQNVVSNISDSTIQISWNDATSTTSWIVKYGTDVLNLDHSITTSTPNVFITGLDYETTYFFRILNNASDSTAFCGSAIYNFTTPCGQVDGCINYTNLNSCHVTARYGTFTNPDQNIGVIDYGSESASSRHTVHTNLNEYDQNTNYGLKTVPPGFDASVRLGNWLTGSQAESITYEYTVDTIKSDLLIMKYAAVLENPNHTPNEQPRFKFQILDEDGLEIDASCYSANFISNVNLGWNSYGNYLWKDWTTVGVDLSQLHGQTIYIKLTTYDCNRSGHFGYAYFVFDCTFKSLSSSNCGNVVENTFTAPDGFSYRWYKSTAPSVTLSTQRSLHVTQAGEYHCSLHFIGAPAGSNCSFDLVAIAGERYPTALFTYEMRDTVGCMTNVQLLNNSVISHDNAHQQLTNLPCEGVIWIFDDGTTSTVNNPIHAFEAGPHTVQLVATLGNGTCTDTLSQQILVANHCAYYDTVYATICNGETYTLFDTVLTASGIYTRDSLLLNRTLYLTVLPPNTTTVDTTIVENSLPFTFGGQQFNDTVSNHTIILTDTYGCDSTIHLTLNVWRNVTVSADSTLCENMLPLHWNGRTFTTDSTVTVNLATIGLHASHGEDSILTMNIHVLRNSSSAWNDTLIQNQLPYLFNGNNYTLASFSNNGPLYASLATTVTIPNAAGCDSSIHVNLHLWRNVTASADSTICQNDAPLQWNGHSFATSGAATVTLTAAALHGVDSTLTMNVNINQNTTLIWHDTVVQNNLPITVAGILFNDSHPDTTIITTNSIGCDSIINFSLHVWHNVTASADSTLCENMLPLHWNGQTFTSDSTITVNLATIGIHATHGEDSTLTMNIHVLRNSSSTWNDTLIQNQLPYLFNGNSYTLASFSNSGPQYASLNTTITIPNVAGCDSSIHVNLHLWRNVTASADSTICQNDAPLQWNGHSFATSGAATVTLTAAALHGVDSTLTMNVNINQNTTLIWHDTVVQNNLPITVAGILFNDSHPDTTIITTNSIGCDSIINFSLHVWHNVTASADSTLCENMLPLHWNGQTFTSDSTVTANLATIGIHASHSEDSTLTMNIHVLHNSSYSQSDTVVQNQLPTALGGCTFNHAVSDTSWIIPNAVGCDSLLHYSLHVWYNYDMHFDSTVCDNQLPVTWCGEIFDASDFINTTSLTSTKTQHLTSIHGADSTVSLTLHVNRTYEFSATENICSGDTSVYGFTSDGNYDVLMHTVHGCDSLLHLNVVVKPVYQFYFSDTICDNQNVLFDSRYVNTPGHHEVMHSTIDGCDSLLVLDLLVNPTSSTFDHEPVCSGLPFTWQNGVTYYTSTYEPTMLFTNRYGCDSILHLILDLDSSYKANYELRPQTPSYTNPAMRIADISPSGKRLWLITTAFGDNIFSDTTRVVEFNYPMQHDSLFLLLVGTSKIGCMDSVETIIYADRGIIWPPNAFTPDLSTNNRFFIPSNDMVSGTVHIYSRQGVLITTFDALTGSWDGTMRGHPCPQDSYVWVITYTTRAKPRIEQQEKGTVTLIR